MKTRERFKNVPFSSTLDFSRLVRVQKGRVVHRPLAENDRVTISLYAMDRGESFDTQSCPGDACFHVLDGEARLNIGGKEVTTTAGQAVVIPADVPHALEAVAPLKLLFTLVR
jgi:quercetin dioxygenase-like cupin family protein